MLGELAGRQSALGGVLTGRQIARDDEQPGTWHPGLFPEMIARAWYQEDLSEGPVAEWRSRGVKPVTAKQKSPSLRPIKLPGRDGVKFARGTKQNLAWAADKDAPYLHRWWLVIARFDGATNRSKAEVKVVTINGSDGNNISRQPLVAFRPSSATFGSHVFDTTFKGSSGPCLSNFDDWNVLLGYRRGWMIRNIVNGTATSEVEVLGLKPNTTSAQSYMGDAISALPTDLAINSIILGQSELNDGQIDKLVGWAAWRAGGQRRLPDDHPYKDSAPTLKDIDENDDPMHYEFDEKSWAAWAAIDSSEKFVNRGRTAPEISGYSTVFFDDFVENTVVDDLTGARGSVWFAPTFNRSLGVQAEMQRPSASPASYIHDPSGEGTMALRLLHNSGWKSGGFSSVNNNGQGRWWKKGIFEIRFKMPLATRPIPGLWASFFMYNREHLFWRTRNRLETDVIEIYGYFPKWLSVSQHVHTNVVRFSDPGISKQSVKNKLAGYAVDAANGFSRDFFEPNLHFFDGEYHTWYMQIEDDYTYVVLDGLEVVRVPTVAELLQRMFIVASLSYDRAHGDRDALNSEFFDMTIDYIRVRQKESDLEHVPSGFNARPAITGSPAVGQTITVSPNTDAAQVECLWYRDGVPVVNAVANSYVLQVADAGHRIRCHVRAVSLLDQPEAWTPETTPVV